MRSRSGSNWRGKLTVNATSDAKRNHMPWPHLQTCQDGKHMSSLKLKATSSCVLPLSDCWLNSLKCTFKLHLTHSNYNKTYMLYFPRVQRISENFRRTLFFPKNSPSVLQHLGIVLPNDMTWKWAIGVSCLIEQIADWMFWRKKTLQKAFTA